MGYYVNPEFETKENFLSRYERLPLGFDWSDLPQGCLPVMLIFNPRFTAAGICYCERELDEFRNPNDDRIKLLFLVPIADLFEVSDLPKEFVQSERSPHARPD